MKVLLLGEFSGLHKNLADGLRYCGIEVKTASIGDGWKRILSDMDWSSELRGVAGKIVSILKASKDVNKLVDYDVVQVVSPIIFHPRLFFFEKLLIDFLKKNNDRLYLVGAGASERNSYINSYFRDYYKYPEFYKILKANVGGKLWSETTQGINYNQYFHSLLDGYIPIMYEYAEPYRIANFQNLKSTIQIPHAGHFEYQYRSVLNRKIKIFHGVNPDRIQEKGSDLIASAVIKLSQKYKKNIEFIEVGGLPLQDYLLCLKESDIVIDQLYFSSYGVNTVQAMSMGKIVLGGGGREFLEEFNLKSSPVIPLSPSVNKICDVIEQLMCRLSEIQDMANESYEFAKEFHDKNKVAALYLNQWT